MSREILRLVVRANSEEDRVATLKEIRIKAEELKVVLRLARETGGIARAKSYEFAAEKIIIVSRQNEGWLGAQLRAVRPESRTPPGGRE